VNRHLSALVAISIYGDDHFYKEHVPPVIQQEIMKLYKTHTMKQTSWSQLMTSIHEVLDVYDEQVKLKKWAPLKDKPKTKEVREVLKVNQTLMAQIKKLETKVNQLETNPTPSTNLKPKYAANGVVILDANKTYSDAIYAILTQEDKDYLTALREQKEKTPQRGGGGGRNFKLKSEITYKYAPNTSTGTREGKDKEGKPTGQTEFYCSKCGFWTKQHGDAHPTRKHDPEFRAKLQAKLNKQKKESTDNNDTSESAGVSTFATNKQVPTDKKVTFLNQDTTPTQETNFNSTLFGFRSLINDE
jgi:hypothetical protein